MMLKEINELKKVSERRAVLQHERQIVGILNHLIREAMIKRQNEVANALIVAREMIENLGEQL